MAYRLLIRHALQASEGKDRRGRSSGTLYRRTEDFGAEAERSASLGNLGVLRTSDSQQVGGAYRALFLCVHPDQNSEEGAAEAFKAVAHAYRLMTQ